MMINRRRFILAGGGLSVLLALGGDLYCVRMRKRPNDLQSTTAINSGVSA